jgi:hypothetical protein
LKGFEVVTEKGGVREETHHKDASDVYASDIITDEFSVQETLLISERRMA